VIIGNSAAAVGCIEGIRQADAEGEILVVSKERHEPYGRPLISYLLAGKTTREKMNYRPSDFYKDNGVTARLGVEVTAVNTAKKLVTLSTGETLLYDKLLIATGSRPFIPPFAGLDTVPDYATFMTLDDADHLAEAVKADSRVLIVGAGLIGLKCAEGILERAASIDVVDMASHVLPSIIEDEQASLIETHLIQVGLNLHMGTSVESFAGNTAKLTNGETLEFDVLVIAVGVRPNTEIAKAAGIAVERGIIIDENSQTSAPDVYAAGDVTQCLDITTGESKILALLPNAYRQGEAAGYHMAGSAKPFTQAIQMNSLGFMGIHLMTAGSYAGEAIVVENGSVDGNYKKLYVKDGVLKGFILIGDVERAGIYTAMVREQTPLQSIDFAMIAKKPQLMAFARVDREKKLGGVV
jgi:NAD(P)H-nitrite reductase large subunit